MLRWPRRATLAIRKLFEPLQDVDVYVEDTNDETFYRSLLNYASGGQVKVARVFGLGGREAVLRAAASYDHGKRRALFIVDGDLSWVKGEVEPQSIGLHRHSAYCVENLLLCEYALSIIISQETLIPQDEARKRLAYQEWRNSVKRPLVELFAAFGTAHTYNPTIPTVSWGVGVMCVKRKSPARTELDHAKVLRARDSALLAAEAYVDQQTAKTHYATLVTRICELPDPLLAVSGKHFLLPLMDFHLQSLGCRVKRKTLRVRLATLGDAGRFAQLANALSVAARGF